jgi:hypothetical protein
MSFDSVNKNKNVQALIVSKKRLNTLTGGETSTNFTYSFNNSQMRINTIVIKQVIIPYTFYGINDLNNILTFNNGAVSITVPPSNYNSSDLTNTLTSLINTAFADTTTSVTFSLDSYKVNITRGTAFIVDAAVSQPTSTFASIIGFTVSSASSLSNTSDSVFNLSGPPYIIINSQYISRLISSKFQFIDSSYPNAIAAVPVLVGPGDTVTLDSAISVPLDYKLSLPAGDIIDISITDDSGNILALNGSDIVIELIFVVD